MDEAEGDKLRGALRGCLRGSSDPLAVARSLLAHVEEGIPLPAENLAVHHAKFDSVEAQLRQLQGLLDAYVVPPSTRPH